MLMKFMCQTDALFNT